MKKGNLIAEITASDLISTCELLGSQGVQGRDFKNIRTNKNSLLLASRLIRFLLDNSSKQIIEELEEVMEIKDILNLSVICLKLEKEGWVIEESVRFRDAPIHNQYEFGFRVEAEKYIKVDKLTEKYVSLLISAGGENNRGRRVINRHDCPDFESVDVRIFDSTNSLHSPKCTRFHFVRPVHLKEIIVDPFSFLEKNRNKSKSTIC
jgi:hypothetical protein